MKNKAPWYKWHPEDFVRDERVRMMTYEQQGVYRALLDHQWTHGAIPVDPEDIAIMLRIPTKDFERIWRRVPTCFEEKDGGLVARDLRTGR